MKNTNPIFSLKNFRSFGEEGADFELAPITVLTGCNSAGKSSAVKAQLLLKDLVEKIHKRFENALEEGGKLHNISPRQLLSGLVLHISDKEYQLGRFNKVLNDQSKDGTITISYTVFLDFLLSNVNVEMSFIGKDDDVINDAVLHRLSIKTNDIILIEMDNLEKEYHKGFFSHTNEHINYLSILPSFEKFMVFCIGDQALKEDLAYDSYSSELPKEKITEQIEIAKNWLKKSGLKKEDIDVFRNVKNITSISPSFADINEFLSKKTLYFWLPLIEQTGNMTKAQVRCWMIEKARNVSSEENDQPLQWVNFFCDDFDASGCNTLFEYFSMLEKAALSMGEIDSTSSGIPYISTYSLGEGMSFSFGDDGTMVNHQPQEKPSARQNYDNNHSFNEVLSSLSYIILGPDSDAPKFNTKKQHTSDLEHSLRSYARATIITAISPEFLCDIKYVNSSSTIVRRLYVLDENDKIGRSIGQFVNGEKQKFIGINKTKESIFFENESLKYITGTFLNKWCKEFNIGKVSIEGTEQGLGAMIYNEKNGRKRLMAEEGYGITQLFTLILQIECCILNATRKQKLTGRWSLFDNSYDVEYEPQIISVEEPEIHLHPKYQSLLADMFVEAYREYNIHFIIETHSEYIVRKLQVMVADKENALTSNDVSLNYVEKNENGISTNRKIDILEDGRLSEPFGTGFFDESKNLVLKMMKF